MRRGVGVIAVAVIVATLGGSSALAGPPRHWRESETIVDQLADCGSFQLISETTIDRMFVERDGHPLLAHVAFTGVIRTSTGEQVGFEKAVAPRSIDFEANTAAVVGLRYHIVFPGTGVVLIDVGRLVIDLETFEATFEAGQHPQWNGEEIDYCAALAG